MAEDLERRAARADDDGGAELGDRDPVSCELRADLVTAGEVMGEAAVVSPESPEVDDPLYAFPGSRRPERGSRNEITLGEVAISVAHRVSQVVSDLDARERGRDRALVQQVQPDPPNV